MLIFQDQPTLTNPYFIIMKNFLTEFKWGVVFTLISLLWIAFEKLQGWHGPKIEQHATYTNFFALVAIVVYVFALLDKRKRDLGGYMTWKQGFFSGAIVSVVVALLSPVSQWITHEVISPEYFSNVIEYSVANNLISAEEARKNFNLSSYIIQGTSFALLVGLATSALVAIFTRRKPPEGAEA